VEERGRKWVERIEESESWVEVDRERAVGAEMLPEIRISRVELSRKRDLKVE
jgi:hypothetical protein